MEWVRENWSWILLAALFIWMLSMHGGHGGGGCGGGHRHGSEGEDRQSGKDGRDLSDAGEPRRGEHHRAQR